MTTSSNSTKSLFVSVRAKNAEDIFEPMNKLIEEMSDFNQQMNFPCVLSSTDDGKNLYVFSGLIVYSLSFESLMKFLLMYHSVFSPTFDTSDGAVYTSKDDKNIEIILGSEEDSKVLKPMDGLVSMKKVSDFLQSAKDKLGLE